MPPFNSSATKLADGLTQTKSKLLYDGGLLPISSSWGQPNTIFFTRHFPQEQLNINNHNEQKIIPENVVQIFLHGHNKLLILLCQRCNFYDNIL
jgi:hypothetical protein